MPRPFGSSPTPRAPRRSPAGGGWPRPLRCPPRRRPSPATASPPASSTSTSPPQRRR
uniref:Histone deacetylase, putative n=1 Tax=Arundo donax TaxID=35708 RepID=A0A0A9AVK4_ARUDO